MVVVLGVVLALVVAGCVAVVWASRGGPRWVRGVATVTLAAGDLVKRAVKNNMRQPEQRKYRGRRLGASGCRVQKPGYSTVAVRARTVMDGRLPISRGTYGGLSCRPFSSTVWSLWRNCAPWRWRWAAGGAALSWSTGSRGWVNRPCWASSCGV